VILNSVSSLPIDTIRLFPKIQAGPDHPYDPTKPPKDWSAAGYVDPNPVVDGFFVFTVCKQTKDGPVFSNIVLSHDDAIACNPVPAGYNFNVGQSVPQAIAEPLDKSKILAGYELGTNFMGMPALVPSVTLTTQKQFTYEDHDAIMAIKAKLGA